MNPKIKSKLLAGSNTCGAITKALAKIGVGVYLVGLALVFAVDVAERREIRRKINNYNNIGNQPKNSKK